MKLKEAILAQALREENLRVPYQQAPNIFHVHEAGYCPLRIYLDKLNTKPEKEEADGRVKMLLADGHMHQAQLTGYIHRAPNMHVTNIEEDRVLVIPYGTPETKEKGERPLGQIVIVGHPDGIIYDMKTKQNWVLEIKGVSRYNRIFQDTKNFPKIEDDDFEGLKEGYPTAIPQSRLLSKMFNTVGAIVLIKNKDTSELKEFHIPRDDKIADKIIEKFMRIAKALDDKMEPPCDYIQGDKRCMFCKYPSKCGSGR